MEVVIPLMLLSNTKGGITKHITKDITKGQTEHKTMGETKH